MFAPVYQQSGADGLSPISVAEAKVKLSKAKVHNWAYSLIEVRSSSNSEAYKLRDTYLSASDCLAMARATADRFCVRVQPTVMRFDK